EVALLARSTERLDIDLLILPDANLILIASVIEQLRGANRISGSELYRWRLLTPDGAPVPTTSESEIPANGVVKATRDEAPLVGRAR
ncbi:GlxA family transcriptional regulator, partial [Rhizobium ruizarguesonis]